MNYLAHGRLCLDDPYVLAGTAVPDWLAVSDRRARVLPLLLPPEGENSTAASRLACGIRRHLADDAWFHGTPAFRLVSRELTDRIRHATKDPHIRAAFLGHILTEMLLDAFLIEGEPALPGRYYEALAETDAGFIQKTVGAWTARPPTRLGEFIQLFRKHEFLRDYTDDSKLAGRLGQVLNRVSHQQLPAPIESLLPKARELVRERAVELLRARV